MTDGEKLDLLLEKMGEMNTRLDSMDARLDSMDIRMDSTENNVKDIKMTLENETNKRIQLLAENHCNLIDKLNSSIKAADKNLLCELQVDILKSKVEHLEKEVTYIKNHIA